MHLQHRAPRLPQVALCLALGGILGCAASDREDAPPPEAPAAGEADAAGSTEHPALASLCRDAWRHELRFKPLFGSRVGDAESHGRLVLPGPRTDAARAAGAEALLLRARAIDPEPLNPADRITLAMLVGRLQLEVEELSTGASLDTWNLDPLDGPQLKFLTLAEDQPVGTPREREQCLERWGRIPAYLDAVAANLGRGLASGRVASATACDKVLAQLDAALATPPERSVLVTGVAADAPAEFRAAVEAVVAGEIYPALARLRATIADDVRPGVRGDDRPGIVHVPGGLEAYAVRVRRETSLDLTPEQIHRIGLDEVARIRGEIADLGERVFGTRDVAAIQARLRSDPALHFTTRDEVEAKARESFERARAAVPALFGRLPETDCIIVRVPEHEERDTTIAYYRRPIEGATGEQALGRYFINTYAPTTRPRYDAEVLAYHEAIPGHHTQLALAQELELPLFRRHTGSTAFVEGWALYTERLCEELGLYSSDIDRFGVLSFDAWRACRLVVDTGMHALGWSRQRAIDYMTENTLLATNNIENEVDRYIAWPGQALAYKLGQREILALRAEARDALGERFDLSAFHDRVLENGAVTLAVLRDYIEAWVASELEAASG